jgi:predicted amidohydrolase
MESFRLAAVQMNGPFGQVEANLDAIERWCRQAADQGARLALFPELVITGHWCAAEAYRVAEPVPDGPSARRLEAMAREFGLVISAGLGEIERCVMYNTQLLVGPGGYIGKQRKTHMSRDEYFHYRFGNELPVHDVGFCKVGTIICFDMIFPEVARLLALHGAEVLLAPHAARMGRWRERGQQRIVSNQKREWKKIYASRAYDSGAYLAVTNQAGPAGPETNHAGGIMVFDPRGEVIAESQTRVIEDEMVVCDLDAEALLRRRGGSCFSLTVRRPEIYGDLAKPTL